MSSFLTSPKVNLSRGPLQSSFDAENGKLGARSRHYKFKLSLFSFAMRRELGRFERKSRASQYAIDQSEVSKPIEIQARDVSCDIDNVRGKITVVSSHFFAPQLSSAGHCCSTILPRNSNYNRLRKTKNCERALSPGRRSNSSSADPSFPRMNFLESVSDELEALGPFHLFVRTPQRCGYDRVAVSPDAYLLD
jgi:hypothetical protein